MAEPGARLRAPLSPGSKAAPGINVCELCGDPMGSWFAVPIPTRKGRSIMRVCRVCFWRSPARGLTGWGAGVRWVAAPDQRD